MATKNNLYHRSPQRCYTKELAEHFRFLLDQEFPGHPFSVRIERFSGGSSVKVTWEDGPSEDEVNALINPFKGRGFDGMTDSTTYAATFVTPDGHGHLDEVPDSRRFSFTAFVHTTRDYSVKVKQRSYAEAALKLGWQLTMNRREKRTPGKYGDSVTILYDYIKPDGSTLITLDDAGYEHVGSAWHISGSAFNNEVRHWRSTTSLYQKPNTTQDTTAPAGDSSDGNWGATITHDRDWTWIAFPKEPPRHVLDLIKARGGRWGKRKKAWYIKSANPDLSFLQAA